MSIKKGDRVNFQFQGKWAVYANQREVYNWGVVLAVSDSQVIVKAGNGAKYYLSHDMIRLPGEVTRDE